MEIEGKRVKGEAEGEKEGKEQGMEGNKGKGAGGEEGRLLEG